DVEAHIRDALHIHLPGHEGISLGPLDAGMDLGQDRVRSIFSGTRPGGPGALSRTRRSGDSDGDLITPLVTHFCLLRSLRFGRELGGSVFFLGSPWRDMMTGRLLAGFPWRSLTTDDLDGDPAPAAAPGQRQVASPQGPKG